MRQFFGTTLFVLFVNLYIHQNNVVSNEIVNLKNSNLRNGWTSKNLTLQDEQNSLDAEKGDEVNKNEDQSELLHKSEAHMQTQGQENTGNAQEKTQEQENTEKNLSEAEKIQKEIEKANKAKEDALKDVAEAEAEVGKIVDATKKVENAEDAIKNSMEKLKQLAEEAKNAAIEKANDAKEKAERATRIKTSSGMANFLAGKAVTAETDAKAEKEKAKKVAEIAEHVVNAYEAKKEAEKAQKLAEAANSEIVKLSNIYKKEKEEAQSAWKEAEEAALNVATNVTEATKKLEEASKELLENTQQTDTVNKLNAVVTEAEKVKAIAAYVLAQKASLEAQLLKGEAEKLADNIKSSNVTDEEKAKAEEAAKAVKDAADQASASANKAKEAKTTTTNTNGDVTLETKKKGSAEAVNAAKEAMKARDKAAFELLKIKKQDILEPVDISSNENENLNDVDEQVAVEVVEQEKETGDESSQEVEEGAEEGDEDEEDLEDEEEAGEEDIQEEGDHKEEASTEQEAEQEKPKGEEVLNDKEAHNLLAQEHNKDNNVSTEDAKLFQTLIKDVGDDDDFKNLQKDLNALFNIK